MNGKGQIMAVKTTAKITFDVEVKGDHTDFDFDHYFDTKNGVRISNFTCSGAKATTIKAKKSANLREINIWRRFLTALLADSPCVAEINQMKGSCQNEWYNNVTKKQHDRAHATVTFRLFKNNHLLPQVRLIIRDGDKIEMARVIESNHKLELETNMVFLANPESTNRIVAFICDAMMNSRYTHSLRLR
jgi:hypothetical protein